MRLLSEFQRPGYRKIVTQSFPALVNLSTRQLLFHFLNIAFNLLELAAYCKNNLLHPITDVDFYLYGYQWLSPIENKQILDLTIVFVKDSKWFSSSWFYLPLLVVFYYYHCYEFLFIIFILQDYFIHKAVQKRTTLLQKRKYDHILYMPN